VVHGGGGELLIPALEDVVLDVDPAAKRMTVSLPEGLRDL
jgi:16S rRNA processing protein RimM